MELLIVVMIVSVLTLISVGSYRGYTQRVHRNEAKNALLVLKTRQVDFRSLNNTFTADLDALGFPGGCTENCVYTIDFTVAPDTRTFTARARTTAGGGTNGVDQTGDGNCQWFTISAQGVMDAGPGADCWGR